MEVALPVETARIDAAEREADMQPAPAEATQQRPRATRVASDPHSAHVELPQPTGAVAATPQEQRSLAEAMSGRDARIEPSALATEPRRVVVPHASPLTLAVPQESAERSVAHDEAAPQLHPTTRPAAPRLRADAPVTPPPTVTYAHLAPGRIEPTHEPVPLLPVHARHRCAAADADRSEADIGVTSHASAGAAPPCFAIR